MRIAVCTTIRNRNQALLDFLLESLPREYVVLSICDCNEESILPLIKDAWYGELCYAHLPQSQFWKTPALNKTEEILPKNIEYLFFADVDMTLPVDFVQQFSENVSPGKVWFPVCFSLNEHAPRVLEAQNGYWRLSGTGMCGFHRPDFIEIGKWDEKFKVYGGEDDDMYNRCLKKYQMVRDECRGLFHNWHPRKRFGVDHD